MKIKIITTISYVSLQLQYISMDRQHL